MGNNLAEQAYDHIRARLFRGDWSPGTRLANRALADALGISFTPVREALQRLASENLVDFRPGAGAFVRAPDRRELAELYDLRLVIEPYAARLAARHAVDFELDALDACNAGFGRIRDALAARDGDGPAAATAEGAELDAWLDIEERFHRTVLEAARNRWLSKVGADLSFVSRVFHPQRGARGLVTAAIADETWRSHSELTACLRARREADAADWMARQIERGRDTVLAYFDRRPNP